MGLFRPNPRFHDELRGQDDFRESLKERAEAAKAKAEPLAPQIMRRNPEAFEVQEDEEGVYLANTDYGGHLAEWGSAKTPVTAPLRRGVKAAGLRLEESPKGAD
jgi:hypothetical protein